MRRTLAAAILFMVCGTPGARAEGDRIWSALVLATKENPPGPIPGALEKFAPAIKRIFGYNTLYLLGEKKRALIWGGEEWLVPSKEFFFKVQCLSQEVTFYTLGIELYRDKNLLLTTEAKLAKDAPLYIRGPAWGKGQLIFLLEVR
ncbi:MAG TPA: hypothetical protein VIS96_02930 [Terrimicrobiaceae bacterium]